MTRDEFQLLFDRALEIAAQNAEKVLGRPVSRTFEIEVHGLAPKVRLMEKDAAFDGIYLGPERFYRIIDLSVRHVSKDLTTVFMRISGHSPAPFDQTWNQPPGSGPFKQLLAAKIEVS